MKEMIVQVSSTKSSMGVLIQGFLAIGLAIASYSILDVYSQSVISYLIYVILLALSLGAVSIMFKPFEKHFLTSTFSLKISKSGIEVIENNVSFLIDWDTIKYIDMFDGGDDMRALRIFPKNSAFAKMNLNERILSQPPDEIVSFIHEVCPIGRNISFWKN